MVDKSSLRSNRPDSSASKNSEKALPAKSNPTSNSQGKPASTRTSSNKLKTTTVKRASHNNLDQSPGDGTPTTNGIDPAEKGPNGTTGDVEMKDDRSDGVDESKVNKDKVGDEEMTVVVPPPKGPKLSAEPGKDDEGDIQMQETSKSDAAEPDEKVDPAAKAVSGQFISWLLHPDWPR